MSPRLLADEAARRQVGDRDRAVLFRRNVGGHADAIALVAERTKSPSASSVAPRWNAAAAQPFGLKAAFSYVFESCRPLFESVGAEEAETFGENATVTKHGFESRWGHHTNLPSLPAKAPWRAHQVHTCAPGAQPP